MLDLMLIVLTVIFFGLSWVLLVVCDRLRVNAQDGAASKG